MACAWSHRASSATSSTVWEVADEKVSVVPLGVNFTPVDSRSRKEDCKRQLAPQLSGRKTVLFVGRFCAAKNLDLWVDVAHMVAQRESSVSFLMAGDGSPLPQIQKSSSWHRRA